MKIKIGLLLLTVVILILSGCGKEKKPGAERTREIHTSRTLGLAYLEKNKLNEAGAEFHKLIDLAPDNPMGYANLGLVYLRQGEYDEAVEQLQEAIILDPENADIHLLLAKVHEVNDQLDQSLRVLKNIIQFAPNHVKTLYSLAEFYGKASDPKSLRVREEYLSKVAELAPQNIIPKLELIKIALRNDKPDEVLKHLEAIRQQYPEFPEEAQVFYDKTLEALHAGKREDALGAARTLHNFLKITSPYQAGMHDLKERGGLIGFPVIIVNDVNS